MSPAEQEVEPGMGRMIRQVLSVAGIEGGRVRLTANRVAACGSCAVQTGCGSRALAEMAGETSLVVALPEHLSLEHGDRVVVSMPVSQFLGAAGLAYLLPPAALALVVGIGSSLGLSDIAMAMSCVPALALSFLPLVRAERNGRMLDTLQIEEVVESATARTCGG